MSKIKTVTDFLENIAPLELQEDYDNAGLITGSPDWQVTGVICSLDCTPDVVQEAIDEKCNLIVCHHPIIFQGLKKLSGSITRPFSFFLFFRFSNTFSRLRLVMTSP